MDYEPCPSDNSDTDEGLAPHQNRLQRAPPVSGNGNSMLGTASYRRVQEDMEHQIHHLEKEAYCAVLRAFKAQSDAISWDKEGLMTELRKELRVSDDEHRELLVSVDNDDTIRRIREWRQAGGHLNSSHPINDVQSPTMPSSRTRPQILQPPPHVPPMQQAFSGPPMASRGRKPRQFPYSNQVAHETPIPGSGDQLVGRKVLTKWPDDNHFYEAVIRKYNPNDGRHELVYGMSTPEESFEWVNIMEIPSEDIRWVNEDLGLKRRAGPVERSISAAPAPGRKKVRNVQPNGVGNMTGDIEILHTDILIKEVEKVVSARNPVRIDIEKAKKMLKDHEEALLDAISRLSYVSDGDSGNRLVYM